jgi:hypothetical protein
MVDLSKAQKYLAPAAGVEPTSSVLETDALPLSYTGMKLAPAERIELPRTEVHNLPLFH